MARRIETTITPHYIPSYDVAEEWNGINKGDPVKVTGERGDFTFIKVHIRNNEVTDVIVHGGTYGNQTVRAFYPHRVSASKKRKRTIRSEDDE